MNHWKGGGKSERIFHCYSAMPCHVFFDITSLWRGRGPSMEISPFLKNCFLLWISFKVTVVCVFKGCIWNWKFEYEKKNCYTSSLQFPVVYDNNSLIAETYCWLFILALSPPSAVPDYGSFSNKQQGLRGHYPHPRRHQRDLSFWSRSF